MPFLASSASSKVFAARASEAVAWTACPTMMMDSRTSCRKNEAVHCTMPYKPPWMAVGSASRSSAAKA